MSKGSIVLIACGSFSPPTYMHLRMFEIARDYIHSFGIGSVVGGIVSPVHDAYGKKDLVASHHRISMLKLALRSSNWIKVSEWESRQAGWTRTRLSLKYHQDIINGYKSNLDPDSAEWLPDDVLNVNSYDETDNFPLMTNGNYQERVTVKLLCGADLLESFATPGLWSDEDIEAIVGTHGLVVVTRAGSNPSKFIHESDILYKHRRNILLVPNHVVNEVSSTVVRRLLRRGESARYLTDDAVLAYAARHALYAAAPEHASLRDVTSSTARPPPGRRAKKTNFLISSSRTDSVSPVDGVKPKLAYVDRVPPGYVPGKAVKIVSDVAQHATAGDKGSGCAL
ncbi:nicotinamide/nicotinic acid mononucleotide adenylyltransferase 3 isoform X2 [Bombyx mandarina]|uniref:Nicotinamide-nucleotide adenylyltransferase n=2 Tax=Bombyx TaxID=7090 RepID=A0A8R2C9P6_BOMMO|nr:nicotinamide/nicotinic acid mononucleotide adenylyltransferase 3 isoform X2 [Bombyx mori]XP_028028100.1 nicotinamide/nicotinic acid mononucleotide adenylyltransferase 3 isoform X2 [Bombyx mandarina]